MWLLLCQLAALLLFFIATTPALAVEQEELLPKGGQPQYITPQGNVHRIYDESNALLIGVGRYRKPGWPDLDAVIPQLTQLGFALQQHGFRVQKIFNPTSVELTAEVRAFVGSHGRKENARTIVVFAGHGYADPDNVDFGFIVPSDAELPKSGSNFYSKAIPISDFETWARQIRSKHALFIFDSCFSGTIFQSKSDPDRAVDRGKSSTDRWRFFRDTAALPVRQFIAAGGPKDVVPAGGEFLRQFQMGMNGSASAQGDGYVTGKEIGTWIEQMSTQSQRPHSNVIKIGSLSLGDMIFQPPNNLPAPVSATPANPWLIGIMRQLAVDFADPSKRDLPRVQRPSGMSTDAFINLLEETFEKSKDPRIKTGAQQQFRQTIADVLQLSVHRWSRRGQRGSADADIEVSLQLFDHRRNVIRFDYSYDEVGSSPAASRFFRGELVVDVDGAKLVPIANSSAFQLECLAGQSACLKWSPGRSNCSGGFCEDLDKGIQIGSTSVNDPTLRAFRTRLLRLIELGRPPSLPLELIRR